MDFNMDVWFEHNGRIENEVHTILEIVTEHPCGTVACLAGHAAILALQEGSARHNSILEIAAEFLGLETKEADQLFYGRWSSHRGRDLSRTSKAAAVRELTRLIEEAKA